MASEEASWEEGVEHEQVINGQASDEQDEKNEQDSSDSGDDAENGDEEDSGEYDPEAVAYDPAAQISEEATSAVPSKQVSKPKVSGGFILEASDDEDEDDDDDERDAAPQSGDAGNHNQPSESTVQASTEQNLSSNAAQIQVSSDVNPVIPSLDPNSLLEVRIKEDPRGEMDAWLALIATHKSQGNFEKLRDTYKRFLDVFPQAAEIWADWAELELGSDEFMAAESIFNNCLLMVPNVRLWTVYLNYIRRRNDLSNDSSGQARQIITASYKFVIDNIGMDKDSGHVWQDYVQFIKTGPGDIHGSGWQDQQKMDQLRKAYHRAINIPTNAVNTLWKEYDQFEMGLNKATGRKLIQERSPGYMTAKSANIALDNIMRNLKRTTIPRLAPAPGFDGDQEYREQVELWKKLIAWEKEDPLVLKADEPDVFQQRILYCYKQALMALRFWPEIWIDAAQWCFENGVKEGGKATGTEMLLSGIRANPESVLLALKHADQVESHYPGKEGDRTEYAKAVRQPYDTILSTLYAMGDKVKERERMEVGTLKQAAALAPPVQESIEDDEEGEPRKSPNEEQIAAIQRAYASETQLLSRTISYVWIALARAMRRIQGKGNQTEGGLRKVFTDARAKGRLTSDVYVAVALLESVVYKDPVGAKIFERGARLFPNDEGFMIEYLKFLHSKDDTTNARVVFEQCANRLVSKPETLQKAKPLYAYFHHYESQFGELSQIAKLEDRMAELFPEDPRLKTFTSRYASDKFNPITSPIIISKAVQMRPKIQLNVVDQPPSSRNSPLPVRRTQSPRPQYARATASPKRPLNLDDDEPVPSKRVARGISPLKGAAGRRLAGRNQSSALHRDITFFLGLLPPSHSFDAQRFSAPGMVNLLRNADVPDYNTWRNQGGDRAAPAPATHSRQPSNDYGNRPISPYGRVTGQGAGYRSSPLRTEQSSNPYAPAPEMGAMPPTWAPPPGTFGAAPPGQYGGYRFQ